MAGIHATAKRQRGSNKRRKKKERKDLHVTGWNFRAFRKKLWAQGSRFCQLCWKKTKNKALRIISPVSNFSEREKCPENVFARASRYRVKGMHGGKESRQDRTHNKVPMRAYPTELVPRHSIPVMKRKERLSKWADRQLIIMPSTARKPHFEWTSSISVALTSLRSESMPLRSAKEEATSAERRNEIKTFIVQVMCCLKSRLWDKDPVVAKCVVPRILSAQLCWKKTKNEAFDRSRFYFLENVKTSRE